ncbi:hypothetical protein F5Y07DRAFT_404395 [Xylaria sp. FL0933]|nr:hypothetical protein F5Y07DRAFT_404395 [Xylaria sp. FL0933]
MGICDADTEHNNTWKPRPAIEALPDYQPTVQPPENEAEGDETKCYQAFLDVAFEPPFHITLLPQVLADQTAYCDLLRPWTRYSDKQHAEDSHAFSQKTQDNDAEAAFSKYVDAATRVLVDNGFAQPFQL